METDDASRLSVKDIMLSRIADSEAHFKHQQRGEPDLFREEKLKIAANMLEQKPVIFLGRFGEHLQEEDLLYFEPFSEQYEVQFYIKEIKKRLNDRKNKQKIRNRRFEAMKKLMTDTDYFSDEEMKSRNPLLYDQLIGQYLTKEEVCQQAEKCSIQISELFMQHLQCLQNTELFDKLKDSEDGQMEESDDDDDVDGEDEEDFDLDSEAKVLDKGDGKNKMTSEEQQLMRTEFVRAMQIQFLNGDDDFNYSEIDNNVEYDPLDIQTQDEEEKYFDEDDIETDVTMETDSKNSKDNGEDNDIDSIKVDVQDLKI